MDESQDEEDGDDFQTIQESDVNEQDGFTYAEGQVLNQEEMPNDSFANFFEHKDSVFSIAALPIGNFDTFISGDQNDKLLIWKLQQ